MPAAKLKVLILAELCNAEWASVPLVGWNHVLHLSKLASVDVVTQSYNAESFKPYEKEDIRGYFIKSPWVDRLYQWVVDRFFQGAYGSATLTFVKIPFYFFFELKAAWIILRDHRTRGWQLVHRITPVSPVIASPVAILLKILGLPFVIGPLNGGLPWPPGYHHAAKEKSVLSTVRDLYRYDPFIYLTRTFAAKILVGSKHTESEISPAQQSKVIYYPENGIGAERLIRKRSYYQSGQVLKAVFVGRLVPLKCPHVALLAAKSFVEAGRMSFDVFGDGPERDSLERLIDSDLVHFHGWISSQQELVAKLSYYDVLVFPSIKEFGGGVVIEAMANGVVPIVMNYGGPSEIVRDEDGFLIPVSNEEKSIEDIRSILSDLLQDARLLTTKSQSAVERIRESYTWERKASFIKTVYEEVIRVS